MNLVFEERLTCTVAAIVHNACSHIGPNWDKMDTVEASLKQRSYAFPPSALKDFAKARKIYGSLFRGSEERFAHGSEAGKTWGKQYKTFLDLIMSCTEVTAAYRNSRTIYQVYIGEWSYPRKVEVDCVGEIALEVAFHKDTCKCCVSRVEEVTQNLRESGLEVELQQDSFGHRWVYLPPTPAGTDLAEYLEGLLGLKVVYYDPPQKQ